MSSPHHQRSKTISVHKLRRRALLKARVVAQYTDRRDEDDDAEE